MQKPVEDQLYGEVRTTQRAFRFHCETLFSRSSLHRFEIETHRHESFLQILCFSGGDGDATLNGNVVAIRPPAIVIAPPGFEHGFRFSKDIAGIIITLIPSALPAAAQAAARQYLKRPTLLPLAGEVTQRAILECCATIWNEYSNTYPGRDAMMEGQITTLIVQLSRLIQQKEGDGLADRNESRFERLLSLIARHIREHRNAQFYAQQLGMSQTHLNRLVRLQCGTSLQRLIAQRQLEIAKQELLFTVSTVQMVASGLGFHDPAYFSRFFLRETGMTPRAWRMAEQQRLAASSTKDRQTSILPSSD
ncbi:helix-turn-helix domain-containing protein [Rhizobium sp. Leaf262]|uniref:helix-turn-helix domain-containing protein n=1 Tax=Rhizobium sp. Leaf262 TaxID=1736312 RepID=UPI000715042D|nr:helix-turn-helix domain-containing protein [Rhizobium sp. Leaf262]KQO77727.1 AraC family transcriptional regulator [Rhizobium sp. Leaf262]